MKEVNKEFDAKMQKTIDVVMSDFASVRAGRANAAVLDKITVDYYGAPTPLNQVAAISSPDPRSLMIQPWDSTLLKAIEKAIQTSDLGINPQNDGKVIRLAFPQHRHLLSEDWTGVPYSVRLFHGELEAPAGGGFRHRGPAEKVSAGVHRKDGEGQN